MSLPYDARPAVVSIATRVPSYEDMRRQVVDRWTSGEPVPLIASQVQLPLDEVESILLTVLFDFG